MALFGLLNKKLPPADFSVLKADMHSHFIPGIDDGAKTMNDSLQLIRAMEEFGYTKVVTTPHIMSDAYRNTPEIILGGLEKVREAVAKAGMKIKVDAAAEYYLDYDFERKLKEKKLLTFGQNYVLFEMAFVNPPDNLNGFIFDMQMAGYRPVMAHVERYGFWQNDYSKYEDFASRGVILQLNINSVTGHYSQETKKAAQWLIDKDMISLVGSDCHHMGHIELMKKAQTDKYMHKLLASKRLLNATL